MDWLICRDICVPKTDSFKLILPVAPTLYPYGEEDAAVDDGDSEP
jgi:DsbC/DsbD-like thiol-disulfide interchange protein